MAKRHSNSALKVNEKLTALARAKKTTTIAQSCRMFQIDAQRRNLKPSQVSIEYMTSRRVNFNEELGLRMMHKPGREEISLTAIAEHFPSHGDVWRPNRI